MSSIYIAYGSESGNSHRLASTLFQQLDTICSPALMTLNEVELRKLHADDTLLIITSSFGDGEPTGNAEAFYESLLAIESINCQFAVFGLGDVSYPQFCGFSIAVDKRLRDCGAAAIANRVDADTHFKDFFEQWSAAVLAYFSGDKKKLKSLYLQVKAYSENQSFAGNLQSVQRINSGEFPVYDIKVDITGSGMKYQAGDLLYFLPPPNQSTLSRLADFYPTLSSEQSDALGKKELRQISKPLLRALVKKTANPELKKLTKMSSSKELASYLYGRDIADVVSDFCTPDNVGVDDLLNLLSIQLPRAYSIASCGESSPDSVRLCVREVAYLLDDRSYRGSGSYFLGNSPAGTVVNVYVRANSHFHLPVDESVPIIMIGAGTGIAPYLGFLAKKRQGEAHLFFGERYCEQDFLYQSELQDYLSSGHLSALYTAFSRDQSEKIYVQDVLLQQGENIWRLLRNGAEIYLCGSKKNLGKSVDQVLCEIARKYGGFDENDANTWLFELNSQNRFHKDLY